MCEKWYKYKDRCPGCGTEFVRKDSHAYLACVRCGFMVSVPSYREAEKITNILKRSVGEEKMKPITIEEYCLMSRMVITEVERLAPA